MLAGDQRAIIELKNAAFHLRKVIVMVEDRKYCLDIIRESKIVQKALKRADNEILTYQLENCARRILENKQSFSSNKNEERQLEEIMMIYRIKRR